jgi:hypothetical protein
MSIAAVASDSPRIRLRDFSIDWKMVVDNVRDTPAAAGPAATDEPE